MSKTRQTVSGVYAPSPRPTWQAAFITACSLCIPAYLCLRLIELTWL